jgi:predicted PurR-regulated permease PerM
MFGRNKGQFFLLFSLIIILPIFAIFFSFPSEQLSKSRENLENYVYLSILSNIEEEQQKIFEYFYFNSSLKDFEKNFSAYIRGKLESRNIEFK